MSIERASSMMKSNKEVAMDPRVEIPRNAEEEILGSSLSKYFKGKADSLPLKGLESSIISALSVYFQGHVKF